MSALSYFTPLTLSVYLCQCPVANVITVVCHSHSVVLLRFVGGRWAVRTGCQKDDHEKGRSVIEHMPSCTHLKTVIENEKRLKREMEIE